MILVVEGIGGTKAMKQSKSYVKGKFWGILGRILVLILIIAGITSIGSLVESQVVTIAIQLISTFILDPLATIYTFKLYRGARQPTLSTPA